MKDVHFAIPKTYQTAFCKEKSTHSFKTKGELTHSEGMTNTGYLLLEICNTYYDRLQTVNLPHKARTATEFCIRQGM